MKTVLVVDDSDVVLEVVKKALESAGYSVITRNKPSGSVAAILRDKPDIVLLDVNMPTLSGDTIAKILARVSQNPETLVLLHSSLSIDNLRLKAIATGAHGYIQKTDSATELVRRVEYWLNRSKHAVSSSRFEAAPAGSTSGAGISSSGRLAAASPVSGGAASGSTSSSGKIEAAHAASAASAPPLQSSASSSRWRAAASSGTFRAASPPDSAPGGTPTSRNIRAAKAAGVLGDNRIPKVLFVDDDWKMLSSYRTMVAGYVDAEFVSSSDDAFNRLLSDSPPEVVVCDVVMPGLSGADIYRRAVMLDSRWASRFVFITGAASTPAVAEFLNTLDVRVFHKPISTDRLLDTLKQMTEVQRR